MFNKINTFFHFLRKINPKNGENGGKLQNTSYKSQTNHKVQITDNTRKTNDRLQIY